MLIPYHSNRLLPLVVADPASSFYDTKINKKNFFRCFTSVFLDLEGGLIVHSRFITNLALSKLAIPSNKSSAQMVISLRLCLRVVYVLRRIATDCLVPCSRTPYIPLGSCGTQRRTDSIERRRAVG
jgi:hypothetical protein